MSQAAKTLDTFLNIVFLEDFDRQKAYSVARKIAAERVVVFNGVITTALPTIPQTFADAVSFTVTQSQINEVFDTFTSQFEIEKKKVRVTLTPVPPAFQTSPAPNMFK